MSSDEFWGYWHICRWLSDWRLTWPGGRADDWWLRHISRRCHVVLSADDSDDPQSECWYLWYSIWSSSCVVIWYPRPLHPSAGDAGTRRNKARALSPWNPTKRRIQPISHYENISSVLMYFFISGIIVCILFYSRDCILFFFIYDLKLSLYYLWFEIKLL
jgi:hypothetical protein